MSTTAPSPEQAEARLDEGAPALDRLAATAQERILQALRASTRRGDAERRKVLQRLGSEVQLLRRLLARNPRALPDEAAGRLHEVLDAASVARPTLEEAWYAADSLRIALLDVGDDAYIGALLEQELVRNRGDQRLSWGRYLDSAELDGLYRAYRAGGLSDLERTQAVEGLAHLFEKRRDDGAHYRARVELKAQAFLRTAVVLGPLILVAAVATVAVSEVNPWAVALTAAAGGLGSTLAGAKELRGMLRINDLRSLSGWSVLQPLVGASAGLVMLLLLTSGILVLPGVNGPASAVAIALYGFLAGFSEPFFLGVVAKIAGTADPAESPPAKR